MMVNSINMIRYLQERNKTEALLSGGFKKAKPLNIWQGKAFLTAFSLMDKYSHLFAVNILNTQMNNFRQAQQTLRLLRFRAKCA